MSLVYFESDNGAPIVFVASAIVAIQQNRLPTDTPTTVMLANGSNYRVRNSFDECQQRLLAAAAIGEKMP